MTTLDNNELLQTGNARHRADADITRVTLRLPAELAETLRTYVFLTRESGNGVIVDALRQYLATVGRDAMVAASTQDTLARYSSALDKLGDS